MSISELTRQAIDKAQKIGGPDALNCIAELNPAAMEQAAAQQRRLDAGENLPFCVPVLVKDNVDVAGLHTTAGSLALSDNLAARDAPVVWNLRRSGAVILGKTNMTEFANYTTRGMPNGYSSRGGQVIHAADPSLDPWGSSSGSGVAVAAGIVDAAVGTDTSFSVIACAQQNGICGLKPPVSALSADGIIPIARTLDSAGAMARDFTTALKLYSAMRDEPLPDLDAAAFSGLRIGVNAANSDQVSPAQNAFLRSILSRLVQEGAAVSDLNQPPEPHMGVIMKWEFRSHLEEYLKSSNASRRTLREIVEYYETNPDTMLKYGCDLLREALHDTPGGLNGKPYLDALAERRERISQVRREIGGLDAVIMTGPTQVMHFCGLPSVTIVGQALNEHGVRRGLILYGADEMRLYRTALAIEKAMQ